VNPDPGSQDNNQATPGIPTGQACPGTHFSDARAHDARADHAGVADVSHLVS
jgi:hypothetical protein